jgi:hypothetical protein
MANESTRCARAPGLLLLGMTMVLAGVLSLTAVRGLARGQRRAWDRAMIGSLLLLVAPVPITPIPVQGELAGFLASPAAVRQSGLVVPASVPDSRSRRVAPASPGRSG